MPWSAVPWSLSGVLVGTCILIWYLYRSSERSLERERSVNLSFDKLLARMGEEYEARLADGEKRRIDQADRIRSILIERDRLLAQYRRIVHAQLTPTIAADHLDSILAVLGRDGVSTSGEFEAVPTNVIDSMSRPAPPRVSRSDSDDSK